MLHVWQHRVSDSGTDFLDVSEIIITLWVEGLLCRLTILIFLLVKHTLLLMYCCKHPSSQPYWLTVPRRLELLRVNLPYPNLFRLYVSYRACLPQCDDVHTFPRFRSVLWKFISQYFNRFCCNTSVNWHICPFSVRNIVLMLNRV